MRRSLAIFAVLGVCLFPVPPASAQTALLAASDPQQVGEVTFAKVMADESTLWLSVALAGRTRIAWVTAEGDTEQAPAADAWLHALDFATRVRIAPPAGPQICGTSGTLHLADSGSAAATPLSAQQTSAASELELRRALEAAGLPVDLKSIARFTSAVAGPYLISVYDAPALGGQTAALRLLDHGHGRDVPPIVSTLGDSVPLNLIALASDALLPPPESDADPSEFSVTYQAATETSDYLAARTRWLTGNSGRWLSEARASSGLFAVTVFPSLGQIAPAVTRYFQDANGTRSSACEARVRAAFASHSQNAADFACEGSDDLARSLSQLGFADLRLSRLFGALGPDGAAFSVAHGALRTPLVVATDFDSTGCPSTPVTPGAGMPSSGGHEPIATPSDPNDGTYYAPGDGTYYPPSDGPSGVSVVVDTSDSCSGNSSSSDSCSGDSSSDSSSSDSCSGDSSSSDSSSSDSCSGNSSSDSSSSDSCSGNSSSDSSSSDSCSGNSSSDSSSSDSGCGKSNYDGDTCSGSSKSSASSQSSALVSGTAGKGQKPRRVHLSLLTLLAAALALPLRRLRLLRLRER